MIDAHQKLLEIGAQTFQTTAADLLGVGVPNGVDDLLRVSMKFPTTLCETNNLRSAIFGVGCPLHVSEPRQLIDRQTDRLLGDPDGACQFRNPGPRERQMGENIGMRILQTEVSSIPEFLDHLGEEVLTDPQQEPARVLAPKVADCFVPEALCRRFHKLALANPCPVQQQCEALFRASAHARRQRRPPFGRKSCHPQATLR